jgi:hypothetical protein
MVSLEILRPWAAWLWPIVLVFSATVTGVAALLPSLFILDRDIMLL